MQDIKQSGYFSNQYSKFIYSLLLVSIWLLTHPYKGISHDAALYTVQALHRLNPSAFYNDVFFKYGSQDQFTFFPPIYAWLINIIGINYAAITLLLGFQIIWLISFWKLAQKFLQGSWLYLAIILAFGMSRYYGGGEIFSYSENFITARIAAESIGLMALAFHFHYHKKIGILFACIATLIHPLIGGWTLLLLVFLNFRWRTIMACIFLSCLIIALARPSLFQTLLTPMDFEWRNLVSVNSPHVFIEDWGLRYWSRACMTITLVVAAIKTTEKEIKVFWESLLILVFLGLATSIIGASIFHNAFLSQLQTWRILWLASALQWITVPHLIEKLSSKRSTRLWLGWLFIGFFSQDIFGGFIALTSTLVYWINSKRKQSALSNIPSKKIEISTLIIVIAAFIVWIPNAILSASLEGGNYLYNKTALTQFIYGLLLTDAFVIPAVIVWWLMHTKSLLSKSILAVLCIVFLCFGVINWDQRTPIQYFTETIASKNENRPFGQIIKSGNTVFWPGLVNITWLALRTGSYASAKQVSGIIFNRQTALEAKRRLNQAVLLALPLDKLKNATPEQLTQELNTLDMGTANELRRKETLTVTSSGLIHFCHDPILDFVVLGTPLPTLFIARYDTHFQKLRFWLYDCRAIRQQYVDPLPTMK